MVQIFIIFQHHILTFPCFSVIFVWRGFLYDFNPTFFPCAAQLYYLTLCNHFRFVVLPVFQRIDPISKRFLANDFLQAADLVWTARTFSVRHGFRFTLAKSSPPPYTDSATGQSNPRGIFSLGTSGLDHPHGPRTPRHPPLVHFRQLSVHG